MLLKPIFGLVLVASVRAFADQTPAEEIAARSRLPLKEVQATLAHCDDQPEKNMDFCAWRDLVVAEHALQKVVDQKISRHPKRKREIEASIERWKKRNYAECEKQAHHDWAGGSFEVTAAVVCEVIGTQDKTKEMKRKP
jgi:uncharacterized protein YecT (DUF1311 family)